MANGHGVGQDYSTGSKLQRAFPKLRKNLKKSRDWDYPMQGNARPPSPPFGILTARSRSQGRCCRGAWVAAEQETGPWDTPPWNTGGEGGTAGKIRGLFDTDIAPGGASAGR